MGLFRGHFFSSNIKGYKMKVMKENTVTLFLKHLTTILIRAN